MSERKGKPLPSLTTDEEAERWLETADLSEYDLSGMKPFRSEFRLKDARVNMRMPHATQGSIGRGGNPLPAADARLARKGFGGP
jgi:predicted DNA binding CopG/RHH family protein